jgi:hypothetical protein
LVEVLRITRPGRAIKLLYHGGSTAEQFKTNSQCKQTNRQRRPTAISAQGGYPPSPQRQVANRRRFPLLDQHGTAAAATEVQTVPSGISGDEMPRKSKPIAILGVDSLSVSERVLLFCVASTNTIEGFRSIFKRGVIGTFHKMSAKYMPLYVAEFRFRYNNRENRDIFGAAIGGCKERLMLPDTWKKQVENSINEAANRQAEDRKTEIDKHNAAITAPLNRLHDQFETYVEQQDRSEKGKSRREIATIIGLFLTAALALGQGVILILQWRALSSTDEATHKLAEAAILQAQKAEDQLQVMKGQLAVMEREQQPYISSIEVANGGPSYMKDGRITWSVAYRNTGHGIARNIVAEWFIKIGEDSKFVRSFSTGKAVTDEFGSGGGGFVTAYSPKTYTRDEADTFLGTDAAIGVLIEFTYFDVSNQRYEGGACVVHYANGAIGKKTVADCRNEKEPEQ